MRVLLVEDEQPLAGYIAVGLHKRGFAVDMAQDGQTALDKSLIETVTGVGYRIGT